MKIYLYVGRRGMEWMYLAQVGDQLWAFVNTVITNVVP